MAFEDKGICNNVMRDRIAMRKKNVDDAANKQISTTKTKDPQKTKKVEADVDGRTPTKLLDRALTDCVEDTSSMKDATVTEADCTAL